jgi:peptidoglycan hydrolase FlgJ
MQISETQRLDLAARFSAPSAKPPTNETAGSDAEHEAFNSFVGEVFFGQMLEAMRKTQGEPAYFHGGRAEEVFQGQFDQLLTQELSEASAPQVADPMYRLFSLNRR